MNMSEEQQRILAGESRRLLLSGVAGSGKSELLIAMLQKLSGKYDPEDILVASFGKRDSEKLTARIHATGLEDISAVTIHSHCYSEIWDDVKTRAIDDEAIARKWLSSIGTLKLVTGHEQAKLVEQSRVAIGCPYDMDYGRDIGYLKSVGIRSDNVMAKRLRTASIDRLAQRLKLDDADDIGELVRWRGAVYDAYQKRLNAGGLLDFGELLLRSENVKKLRQYKVLVIDESQDLSVQQLRVLKPLLQRSEQTIVCFDEYQSIYSFRGAVGQNIGTRMRQVLPDATSEQLVMNHRSLPAIVAYAETIFKRGMVAMNEGDGKVAVAEKMFTDEDEHATFILDQVQRWHDSGMAYRDIAILCRMRKVMPVIEETFFKAGVPVVKGVKPFTDLPEIKDLTAWLEMGDASLMFKKAGAVHPFWRVFDAPYVGLDKNWRKLAKQHHCNVEELLRPSLYPDKYAVPLRTLQKNLFDVSTLRTPADILMFVSSVMNPCYRDYQMKYASEMLGDPMDNVNNMIRLAREFDDIGKFLNFLKALDRIVKTDAVTLTTIHGAKGLEWDAVVLVNCIGHYLRYSNAEEEKRIRYVGATRPSRYLLETSLYVGGDN